MGIFGPTKKGGGLDRRFSSNKGGYAGKIIGGLASMKKNDDDDDDDYVENERINDRLKHYDKIGGNLTSRDMPQDEEGVIEFIDEMIGVIEFNGWSMVQADKTDDKKAQGRISDSAMSKLEIGIFKLHALGSPYHMFYEKKYKRLKLKKFMAKYGLWASLLFAFVVLFLIHSVSVSMSE